MDDGRESKDLASLDPTPYLAAARRAIAVLDHLEPRERNSRHWEWYAEKGEEAFAALRRIGEQARGATDGLALVGLDPFHPDGVGAGPGPRGLGRRNTPETMP